MQTLPLSSSALSRRLQPPVSFSELAPVPAFHSGDQTPETLNAEPDVAAPCLAGGDFPTGLH